jgi:hypothetical protein
MSVRSALAREATLMALLRYCEWARVGASGREATELERLANRIRRRLAELS